MSDIKNLIVVASPFLTSGGGYRALVTLKEYKKRGLNPFLIIPEFKFGDFNRNIIEELKKNLLVDIVLASQSIRIPRIPLEKTFRNLVAMFIPNTINIPTNREMVRKASLVISLHETFDSIVTAKEISSNLGLKRAALLQLPPFYSSKSRIQNIYKCYYMWSKVIYTHSKISSKLSYLITASMTKTLSRYLRKNLKKFDLLLAVSPTIPLEMGKEWFPRIRCLNPGVTLDIQDLQLIKTFSRSTNEKENLVIFGGRPVADKGLLEALLAWRLIKKSSQKKLKLVITGNISKEVMMRLKCFTHKLAIDNSVTFTGFLPRAKRLQLVARAKVMLYPSHVDAFSLTVAESISLGTPVIAYDIPAIKFYYSNNDGVKIVKEFDLDAFVQEALILLDSRGITFEKPCLPSWDEIIDQELEFIKNALNQGVS
jgi:glycosyltransferase involved in cell wall biosynthesis